MTTPGVALELVQAASAAINAGDNQRAGEILVRIVSTAPDWAPGRVELGMFLVRTGRTEDGLMQLQEACSRQPIHANTFLAIGAVEHNFKRHDAATGHFRRALLIDPAHLGAIIQFARASLRDGNFEAARRVLSVHPILPWIEVQAFHLLAETLNRIGEPERVREVGFRGPVTYPDDPVALCFLANVLLRNAEQRLAFDLARRASLLAPNSVDVLRVFSEIALLTGHAHVAAHTAALGLRLSDSPQARFTLGRALIASDQAEAAEKHLREAERHGPFGEQVRILLMTARRSDFQTDLNELNSCSTG